jgi:ATP-binding cassette subfamily F protein 3
MIRNILGGFLFSGDDVYKHVRVLSGGERTRLAVARMLLQPSNTLLLDEPTNHLDLDSKEVLLDALVDYGGTLLFVSHDRYFVERLATKIIEVGNGTAVAFPGTYKEFLYHKAHAGQEGREGQDRQDRQEGRTAGRQEGKPAGRQEGRPAGRREGKAKVRRSERPSRKDAPTPTRSVARAQAHTQISARSPHCGAGTAMREIEGQMTAPGFYEDHLVAQPIVERHQALMWQLGDLMHQWESLQSASDLAARP